MFVCFRGRVVKEARQGLHPEHTHAAFGLALALTQL